MPADTHAEEVFISYTQESVEHAEKVLQLSNRLRLEGVDVFYTVSENAGALYTRYIAGEEKLAKEGLKVATDCTDILKKRKATDSTP